MIRVNRPLALAPPAWLTKARTETDAAIAAYKAALKKFRALKSSGRKLEYAFEFKVYGDDLLRTELNKVYGYKCAYCESFFGATQPVAVEHYRPKGEVIVGTQRIKPGYYWLAATWDNLLPSCTDCNSPRRQEVEGGKPVVRGKGNYFPLGAGSRRARSPGQERRENPLLLNPELDDPEQHLEFTAERDRAGVIRAALIDGNPSPKGAASIEVYALDRPQLTRARADFAARLFSHIRNTLNSRQRHQAKPRNAALKREYDENLADLATFLASTQPYAAMARQIARVNLPGVQL